MSEYTPLHDRPPYYASLSPPRRSQNPSSPRYASPDLDPDEPYPWISRMSEGYDQNDVNPNEGYEVYEEQGVVEAGPSRKRHRMDESNGFHGLNDEGRQRQARFHIIPSMFGISPRNEFTKTIGEFIMNNARGQVHVEVEIKLGTLLSVTPAGTPPRRVNMPTLSEMIIPPDYPVGGFVSNMNKASIQNQNQSLNRLLNSAAESSQTSPFPIQFFRAQQTDSFYNMASTQRGGGKIRVSRDRSGRVIENGVIRKKRIGDVNVYSPREAFDWRVSVSTEEPCEMPKGPPAMTRDKDRACYRHQLCQVDLTVVTTKPVDGSASSITFELEIEISNVPALLAEGEREERGQENRFDEILQSCLDTVRMLIRNVEG